VWRHHQRVSCGRCIATAVVKRVTSQQRVYTPQNYSFTGFNDIVSVSDCIWQYNRMTKNAELQVMQSWQVWKPYSGIRLWRLRKTCKTSVRIMCVVVDNGNWELRDKRQKVYRLSQRGLLLLLLRNRSCLLFMPWSCNFQSNFAVSACVTQQSTDAQTWQTNSFEHTVYICIIYWMRT
jgi:hypothetical protein